MGDRQSLFNLGRTGRRLLGEDVLTGVRGSHQPGKEVSSQTQRGYVTRELIISWDDPGFNIVDI